MERSMTTLDRREILMNNPYMIPFWACVVLGISGLLIGGCWIMKSVRDDLPIIGGAIVLGTGAVLVFASVIYACSSQYMCYEQMQEWHRKQRERRNNNNDMVFLNRNRNRLRRNRVSRLSIWYTDLPPPEVTDYSDPCFSPPPPYTSPPPGYSHTDPNPGGLQLVQPAQAVVPTEPRGPTGPTIPTETGTEPGGVSRWSETPEVPVQPLTSRSSRGISTTSHA